MPYHAVMEFRYATGADIEKMVPLINLAFRVERFMVEGDRTSAKQMESMLQKGTFLIGEASGRIAGCLYLELRRERAYFGLLAVDPELQGQGRGRRLIEEAERRAAAAGCHTMDLHAVNVRSELIPMYKSMGYTETGTAPFPAEVPTKIPCHFIKMSKILQSKSETRHT
jgi:GNAT superfamily N-acetyltransferase